MVVGADTAGFEGQITGISIDLDARSLKSKLAELTNATASYLGLKLCYESSDFAVNDAYIGDGYGVFGDLERNAILTLGQTEGILLDPVYTGRAFGGLLEMIRRGELTEKERVLFWHTGGTSGLFSYAEQF